MPDLSFSPLPAGWEFQVRYKAIRHIWFRADYRNRIFRISAPKGISRVDLNRALHARSGWMNSQALRPQVPILVPSRVSFGDTCMVRGGKRTVTIEYGPGRPVLQLDGNALFIRVRPGTGPEGCARALVRWLRAGLSKEMETLAAKWQERLQVTAGEWRIRQMKTRWGSCNTRAGRIWINLALACLAPELLEYVMVHELIHLKEPGHTPRFYRLLEAAVPDSRVLQQTLKTFAPGLS